MPELLFKYRPLVTKEDVIRIYDVFHNNRLYYPKISQLNDPLEGTGASIHLGYAGSTFSYITDTDLTPVQSEKELYRILSFSSDCFSPQMWAYYCANYNGICLGFSGSKSFASVQPVIYNDQKEEIGIIEPNIPAAVLSALLKKQSGWIVENEWRIVEKTDDCYFSFNPKELICVVLGHGICTDSNHELYDFILSIIPKDVHVFRTYPGKQSRQISLIKNGYELPGDGSRPNFIASVDELVNSIQVK